MPANTISEDLRSRKTEKALYEAMFTLLRKSSFRKLTIKGICEEAFISRAAFYAHFIDKYDLLKHWMKELWPEAIYSNDPYDQIEGAVNIQIQENVVIYKNIVSDADFETFCVIFDFLLTTVDLSVERKGSREEYHKNVVLSNFYAGGIISYLLWQTKNKFPADVPVMNRYFYEIIHDFQ